MKIPYNAKIVFYCDSGANHKSKRQEEFSVSDLTAYTETRWDELSLEAQQFLLDGCFSAWLSGYLEYGWYQKEEE